MRKKSHSKTSSVRKRYPMFHHLIIPLLALAVIQTIIFRQAVSSSGIISDINKNSENMLSQYAQKNTAYLETEMLKKWSRIEDLTNAALDGIRDEYSGNADYNEEANARILASVSDNVISTLRTNAVTGAYVILCSPDKKPDNRDTSSYSGIFMLDDDPYHNSNTNSDLIMLRGPAEISSRYGIPLDIEWSEKINTTAAVMDKYNFLFEPVNAAYEHINMNYDSLGYWGVVQADISEINRKADITYSVPLIFEGKVYGVAGISVSIKNIVSLLPSSEIMFNNSGYCIITYDWNPQNDEHITAKVAAISNDGIFKSSPNVTEITLDKVKNSKSLYKLSGLDDNSDIYAALSDMSLYKAYTPFSETRWSIAAVTHKSSLYSVTHRMTYRAGGAVLISMFISTMLAYFVSKRTVKPVAELNKAVKDYAGIGKIKVVDVNVREVYELSEMLNVISSNLTKTQNELVAEKERYITALQSANDDMIEYDPVLDILVLYNFRTKNSYEHYKTIKYTHFLGQVKSGNICHAKDIDMFVKFLNGEVSERFTLRVMSDEGYEGYLWYEISGKPIFDTNNQIQRIIASRRDVTESKAAEIKKLEEDRRDNVTKFYKLEYGEALVQKVLVEGDYNEYCLARIRISNADVIRREQGTYYYDALLEEIGIVINEYIKDNDVVFRASADEFVFLKVNIGISDMVRQFDKMRKKIEKIYEDIDSSLPLKCCIGVAEANDGIDDMQRCKNCLGLAVCAAEISTVNSHNGMVFKFKDAEHNQDAYEQYETYERSNLNKTNRNSSNDKITSFVLNILEKTNSFDNAMKILLAKLGRTMNMNRIIIYDINPDFYTTSIDYQWCKDETSLIENQVLTIGKSQLERLKVMFAEEKDYVFADKDYYDTSYPIINEIINNCGDNNNSDSLILFVPMFETNRYIGNVLYEFSVDIDNSTKEYIIEITRILSAYISKSKTSLESRAKSDFLSRMSHEIRTPMNAIMSMTTIAQSSEGVPAHVADYLGKIDRSAAYLMSLINDILDMSRIESGKMTVEETYLNLDDVISQLDTMIRVQTDAKNVGLIVKKSVDNIHLIGDPLKLNQVLINILGNAVKFTSSGSITFTVTQKNNDNDSDYTQIRFSIKDTGIGIKEENLDHIFNSFEQEDTQTARKYGGTGLGLSISYNLVRMMGGMLAVQSEYGAGTEFMFTLPYRIAKESEIVHEDISGTAVSFDGKLVLLVEDDELNVEIAETLLDMDGISIEHAENGQVAVDMFSSKPPDYYDAILMDIRMPVMDGLEATKLIRNLEREDAVRIPIVAMSANAFDADMKKSVECGMNGHLSKPIDMNKVRTLLAKIWRNQK